MSLRDDNFDNLLANWAELRHRVVVFLGAGASIGARNTEGEPLPTAYQLRNDLWRKFKAGPDPSFNPSDLGLMSLEHAAAIIETRTHRTILGEYLIKRFTVPLPLWQHIALPYLTPKSLFTTNYDELVEQGYHAARSQLDVICERRMPVPGRTALYKPHGSLTHANQKIGSGGLVITQFDYLEMLSEYRDMLRMAMSDFHATCVLIVGYSFGDMDIGSELYALRKRNADIPWYAVFPRNDPQVRKMYADRFHIDQINATFEEFLGALDDKISFVPTQLKLCEKARLQSEGVIQ